MRKYFKKIFRGYAVFKKKYVSGNTSLMKHLSEFGQKPDILVVACCDSRVDPAVILQTNPGDLFVIRNVANIVPPYEKDEAQHGTSAALEFGINFLNVQYLILLGHSKCGGINAAMHSEHLIKNDFLSQWVSLAKIEHPDSSILSQDEYAKLALKKSYQNCLTFPWIKEKVDNHQLKIYLWFFDIETGSIQQYSKEKDLYFPML